MSDTSDRITTPVAYTYFQSGWTDESKNLQNFTSEEDVLDTLYRLAQPFISDLPSTMVISNYNCSASFQPQPIEIGTCPSLTLPYESIICEKWDEMMQFANKYKNWPYVDICANVNLTIKNHGYTITKHLPTHIFYKRLKPITK